MAIGGDGDRGAAVQGWETPKRAECRIPAVGACPPPPRKKKSPDAASLGGKKRAPPKGGYFCPPDLEALFALKPRRETCA